MKITKCTKRHNPEKLNSELVLEVVIPLDYNFEVALTTFSYGRLLVYEQLGNEFVQELKRLGDIDEVNRSDQSR